MVESKAIKKIHSFERFGSKLGLERMNVLLEELGNPQENMKVIHVAGTNGKGSVCRYTYSVLQEHGYKTGLYTSPFLENFNERIEFNGEVISEEDLEKYTSEVMEKVEAITGRGLESPTEFEVITAIAFLYFSKKDMDFLVLEVGLGGSGDSTNVIEKPIVSVIVSISLDHTDRLGETIPEIAREKAGIIKNNCPVIVNVPEMEGLRVIGEIAYEKNAPLIDVSKSSYEVLRRELSGYTFTGRVAGRIYGEIELSMAGDHQIENAMCAITVIDLLREKKYIRTDGEKFRKGMKKAVQPGRFEVVSKKPLIILDGAHNQSGAKALALTIEELMPKKELLVVFGVLKDKSLDSILEEINKFATEYIATEPNNNRKLSAEELLEEIKKLDFKCTAVPDSKKALQLAMNRNEEFDGIIVAGSLYLIGEIRRILGDEQE